MRSSASPVVTLVLTLALLGIGLIMVYSSSAARAGLEERMVISQIDAALVDEYPYHSASYLTRQLAWAAAGLLLMAGLVLVDSERLFKIAPYAAVVSLVTLALVVASPLGVTSKGATRWLRLGPFTVQPSEFAKPVLVLLMAWHLTQKRDRLRDFFGGFLPLLVTCSLFLGLILVGRDLGTTVVLGAVVFGMWALARIRPAHLLGLIVLTIPLLIFAVLKHSYRINRVLSFFEPERYALTTGYQLHQSLIAVGTGGLYGRGLGQGLQKYMFLSESHTDFIFAILCEEMGFVGGAVVVMLFLFWTLQGLRIALRANTYFGFLVAAGMTMVIGISAFANFMVVLGLAPTKGLALPFISYGGSSLMSALICTGILISISNTSIASKGAHEMLPGSLGAPLFTSDGHHEPA